MRYSGDTFDLGLQRRGKKQLLPLNQIIFLQKSEIKKKNCNTVHKFR